MTSVLSVLAILMVLQGLVSIRDGRRNARYAVEYPGTGAPDPASAPFVRVFCPVRGAAPDLEANVRSLLDQDYRPFRVVFIVESEADPAHAVLGRVAREADADLVVAGPASDRGQKVHNLATAVLRLGTDAEIFAFADADVRFPAGWLSALTAPLCSADDVTVGATTGYRWYVAPVRSGWDRGGSRFWATSFRSAWNASVAGFLGPGPGNFAWGGSTAIRRDTFERVGVARAWEGAVSDDFALTAAIRTAGLSIVFVPTCLVPSGEDCRWRDLWEFSTRQMKITRVYAAPIWRMALISYALFATTLVGLTLSLSTGPLPAGFLVLLVTLAAIRADARLQAARRAIDHPSLVERRWFYRLAALVVAFLFVANAIAAGLSRRIVWKDIAYRMVSPSETVVDRSATR